MRLIDDECRVHALLLLGEHLEAAHGVHKSLLPDRIDQDPLLLKLLLEDLRLLITDDDDWGFHRLRDADILNAVSMILYFGVHILTEAYQGRLCLIASVELYHRRLRDTLGCLLMEVLQVRPCQPDEFAEWFEDSMKAFKVVRGLKKKRVHFINN